MKPLRIPSQAYATEWVDLFSAAYPVLKDQAREIFTRLAGHSTWTQMIEQARHTTQLFDFDQLSVDERLSMASGYRQILSEEFGMRVAVANHVAWTNPPGSECFWKLHSPAFSVLRERDDQRSTEAEYARMDMLNRSRCLETPEGQNRLNAKPDIGAHLGLLKHLGWSISVLGVASSQLSAMGDADRFYAEPVAMVTDADLGEVPVFIAGFTSHPGAAHDEVMTHYITGALSTAELLHGAGSPAIVLYEESLSGKMHGQCFTSFGLIVYDFSCRDLYLNQMCTKLSDVFVNLVATSVDSPAITEFADKQFSLQRMFERARQKNKFAPGAPSKLFFVEGPSGWNSMLLLDAEGTAGELGHA